MAGRRNPPEKVYDQARPFINPALVRRPLVARILAGVWKWAWRNPVAYPRPERAAVEVELGDNKLMAGNEVAQRQVESARAALGTVGLSHFRWRCCGGGAVRSNHQSGEHGGVAQVRVVFGISSSRVRVGRMGWPPRWNAAKTNRRFMASGSEVCSCRSAKQRLRRNMSKRVAKARP